MDEQKRSNNFIKHMKPRKNGFYHQGTLDPKKFNKCAVKDQPIIFRSGLEKRFIQYVQNQSSITKWASEAFAIPYYSRLDKRQANYYPDFIIENKDGHKTIVEIKPYAQTKRPKEADSAWLKEQWIKNTDKWKAAMDFAKKHEMKFCIVTEKFFE